MKLTSFLEEQIKEKIKEKGSVEVKYKGVVIGKGYIDKNNNFIIDITTNMENTTSLEEKKIKKCSFCQENGWYWKQPLPDYLIPSGNYGRLGNEVKAPCPWCREGGVNSFFKKKNEEKIQR